MLAISSFWLNPNSRVGNGDGERQGDRRSHRNTRLPQPLVGGYSDKDRGPGTVVGGGAAVAAVAGSGCVVVGVVVVVVGAGAGVVGAADAVDAAAAGFAAADGL